MEQSIFVGDVVSTCVGLGKVASISSPSSLGFLFADVELFGWGSDLSSHSHCFSLVSCLQTDFVCSVIYFGPSNKMEQLRFKLLFTQQIAILRTACAKQFGINRILTF